MIKQLYGDNKPRSDERPPLQPHGVSKTKELSRSSPCLEFIALAMIWLLVLDSRHIKAAEFIPLGFDVYTNFTFRNLAVSEDGAVVIGNSISNGLIKWTKETGPVVILNENGELGGVSGDGKTIASTRAIRTNTGFQRTAVRIAGGTVYQVRADSEALAISQDGRTIVVSERLSGNSFRWVDGNVEPLPLPIQSGFSFPPEPQALSSDGKVLVGMGPGFRWTDHDGLYKLSGIEEDVLVHALGVSSDGRWTVGGDNRDREPQEFRAIRWDGVLPPTQLIPTDATWGATGKDVTADGSFVVGRLYLSNEPQERYAELAAGVWHEQIGRMVPLQNLLVERYGADPGLDGYHLTGVYDVTNDGRFMVGHAVNPGGTGEAFLVDLGLRGDFDGDEVLDVDDLDELSEAIRSADTNLRYDIDYSNVVDSLDYQIWVTDLKGTWIGDANLDGEFNSSDLVAVFEMGQYEDAIAGNSSWAAGDWNGDGEFTTSDLVLAFQDGGYEQGALGAATAVPEPNAWCLLLFGAVVSALGKRHATSW
jgi:hypothetical protein